MSRRSRKLAARRAAPTARRRQPLSHTLVRVFACFVGGLPFLVADGVGTTGPRLMAWFTFAAAIVAYAVADHLSATEAQPADALPPSPSAAACSSPPTRIPAAGNRVATEDRAFLAKLDRTGISARDWTFQKYLRLVHATLREEGSRAAALPEVRRRLRQFDQWEKAEHDYYRQDNPTAMDAWLAVLEAHGVRRDSRAFHDFLADHPELRAPGYLRRHYSARLLRSAAREGVVSPDREALPLPGQLQGVVQVDSTMERILARDRRRAWWRAWKQALWRGVVLPLADGLRTGTIWCGGLAFGGWEKHLGITPEPTAEMVLGIGLLIGVLAACPRPLPAEGPMAGLPVALRFLVAWVGMVYTSLASLVGYSIGWPAIAVWVTASLVAAVSRAREQLLRIERPGVPAAHRLAPRHTSPGLGTDGAEQEAGMQLLTDTAPASLPGDPACPFCADPLAIEAVIRCPGCDTPHHADCWEEAGCTTYGCRG